MGCLGTNNVSLFMFRFRTSSLRHDFKIALRLEVLITITLILMAGWIVISIFVFWKDLDISGVSRKGNRDVWFSTRKIVV